MKKICLTLTVLALLLLLAGCAVRDNEEKDSYIIIHSIASDTDTKVTPEDKDYDTLLDSLFDAAGESVGTVAVLSEDAVQTGTITYYQAPTRTVLGGSDRAYAPILSFDLYDDGGESYAESYFCADETKTLKFCFPVPAELCKLVSAWTSGSEEDSIRFETSSQNRPEKMHEDVAAENFQYINISGNAASIVIKRSESENFEFYNGDLNTAHTYTVRCDKQGETLDIEITMENPEKDNDVLGSPLIAIPQKEFEKIEVMGDFRQVSLYTLHADVLIHANDSCVNLDVEADHLEHNITLDGSESNVFRGVSVYFDQFPENVSLELNTTQGGVINDPQGILEENSLASGSKEPVIRINDAKEINIYRMD